VGIAALEWAGMRRFFAFLSVVLALNGVAADEPGARPSLFIVVGAPGEKDYGEAFARWAENWERAGAAANAHVMTIGIGPSKEGDLAQLEKALQTEPTEGLGPIWLVLLGHGTANAHDAKFNLRSDDLSASTLVTWLKVFRRPLVLLNTFSSSGAFLAPLAGADRIIITATKSGSENNFSRLGKYLSEAIADPSADLDHDGQTSLLEAWVSAAQSVADFYKSEGRLATEHSLLDDNGDGFGTPADWFRGIRLVKKSSDKAPDGLRAHQMHLVPSAADRGLPPERRAERDALERELAALREIKTTTPVDEYYGKLEEVLLRLARIYGQEKNLVKP
jgi:hypothetical protein